MATLNSEHTFILVRVSAFIMVILTSWLVINGMFVILQNDHMHWFIQSMCKSHSYVNKIKYGETEIKTMLKIKGQILKQTQLSIEKTFNFCHSVTMFELSQEKYNGLYKVKTKIVWDDIETEEAYRNHLEEVMNEVPERYRNHDIAVETIIKINDVENDILIVNEEARKKINMTIWFFEYFFPIYFLLILVEKVGKKYNFLSMFVTSEIKIVKVISNKTLELII